MNKNNTILVICVVLMNISVYQSNQYVRKRFLLNPNTSPIDITIYSKNTLFEIDNEKLQEYLKGELILHPEQNLENFEQIEDAFSSSDQIFNEMSNHFFIIANDDNPDRMRNAVRKNIKKTFNETFKRVFLDILNE